MNEITKIAIVGTSSISEKFADAFNGLENVQLTAVYSRTKEKAEVFAQTYKIPEIYTSLDELAKTSTVDAVYIASPNSCHCSQSMQMMQSGKHVLCEKPIATCAAEFLRMLECAKENEVLLLEATRFFHAPGLEILKDLLPEIAPVRRASIIFNQYSSKYDALKAGMIPNIFSKEFAGGALMDLGVYCVELMVALFGVPAEIVSSVVLMHSGVDGQGAVIAKYDDLLVELSYSKICQAAAPCVIQGEEGSLIFTKPSIIDKIDVIKRNGESRQIICHTIENDMVYELQAFVEAIKKPYNAELFNDYSMKAQSIMDEIKKQMYTV